MQLEHNLPQHNSYEELLQTLKRKEEDKLNPTLKTRILEITKLLKEGDILNVSRRNNVTEEEIQRMVEDIAEEITEPDLSELKRLGIDEIALVKGQKNYPKTKLSY